MNISLSSRNGVKRSSMKNTGMHASPSAKATGTRSEDQRGEHAEQDQRDLAWGHAAASFPAITAPRTRWRITALGPGIPVYKGVAGLAIGQSPQSAPQEPARPCPIAACGGKTWAFGVIG